MLERKVIQTQPHYIETAMVGQILPETGWSDLDIFEVNYPDKVQVQIDRNDGDFQIRVWKIGDDNPLETLDVHHFVCGHCCLSDTFGHTVVVSAECDQCEFCTNCCQHSVDEAGMPYTDGEIEAMTQFARGVLAGKEIFKYGDSEVQVDAWFTFKEDLDVHLYREDDAGVIKAFGYRRNRPSEGDCTDEVLLFEETCEVVK